MLEETKEEPCNGTYGEEEREEEWHVLNTFGADNFPLRAIVFIHVNKRLLRNQLYRKFKLIVLLIS